MWSNFILELTKVSEKSAHWLWQMSVDWRKLIKIIKKCTRILWYSLKVEIPFDLFIANYSKWMASKCIKLAVVSFENGKIYASIYNTLHLISSTLLILFKFFQTRNFQTFPLSFPGRFNRNKVEHFQGV